MHLVAELRSITKIMFYREFEEENSEEKGENSALWFLRL